MDEGKALFRRWPGDRTPPLPLADCTPPPLPQPLCVLPERPRTLSDRRWRRTCPLAAQHTPPLQGYLAHRKTFIQARASDGGVDEGKALFRRGVCHSGAFNLDKAEVALLKTPTFHDMWVLSQQRRHKPAPHGGVRPFHQKWTCLTRLTLGTFLVQIWSRNTPEYGVSKTLALHRVDWGRWPIGMRINVSFLPGNTYTRRALYRGTSLIRNNLPP